MTEPKRRLRRRSRFLPGFLIYLLILSVLLGAALYVLQDYLTVFEATRPERALEQYRRELVLNGPGESCREALSALDPRLQDMDEAEALAAARLQDARYVEDVSESREEQRVYRLLSEGVECGRLTLRRGEPQRYGFAPWAPAEVSFDFSHWFTSRAVTVTEDCSVYFGDHTLDASYIAARGIPFEALRECYEHLEDLPTLVRYETGPLWSEEPLRVFDAAGRELSPDEQNEDHYLDNCTPEQKQQMQTFAELFVSRYVNFTAYRADYQLLSSMLAPGSAAARRLEQAVGEKWWSGSSTCDLLSCGVNRCVDLGEGRLLLDLTYETETRVSEDPVTGTYSMRLVLVEQNGSLRAIHIFNY